MEWICRNWRWHNVHITRTKSITTAFADDGHVIPASFGELISWCLKLFTWSNHRSKNEVPRKTLQKKQRFHCFVVKNKVSKGFAGYFKFRGFHLLMKIGSKQDTKIICNQERYTPNIPSGLLAKQNETFVKIWKLPSIKVLVSLALHANQLQII